MKTEIFDDMLSLAHIAAAAISHFIPAFIIIFILYEVAEFSLKRGKEPVSHFIGDICEFCIGYTLTAYIIQLS